MPGAPIAQNLCKNCESQPQIIANNNQSRKKRLVQLLSGGSEQQQSQENDKKERGRSRGRSRVAQAVRRKFKNASLIDDFLTLNLSFT